MGAIQAHPNPVAELGEGSEGHRNMAWLGDAGSVSPLCSPAPGWESACGLRPRGVRRGLRAGP